MLTSGLRNGGKRLFLPTTDWNSRTEQSERPERDRLIALLLFYRKMSFEKDCFEMKFLILSVLVQ
jgi:hypothetical protein